MAFSGMNDTKRAVARFVSGRPLAWRGQGRVDWHELALANPLVWPIITSR
jgi:hypothetical protein